MIYIRLCITQKTFSITGKDGLLWLYTAENNRFLGKKACGKCQWGLPQFCVFLSEKKKKKSFLLFGSNVDYYCQSEVSEYESADSLLVKGVWNGKLKVFIAKV